MNKNLFHVNKRLGTLIVGILVTVTFTILLLWGKQAMAAGQESPYLIKVNRYHNTITIYEKDEQGKYTVPIKAIVCSVGTKGTPTVLGTYRTQAKYRWKELYGKVYGQYSTRIVGNILFHSVYYYTNQNPATLSAKQYNKLGTAASQGCIRMNVEDAKWIYDNCPVGTTVTIYDDKKSPGPLGKPEAIKLPAAAKWDPTDPSPKNPYKDTLPTLRGVKKQSYDWGSEIDLIKGVTAKSSVGIDITDKIVVEGEVNTYVPGVYPVKYSVTDALGRSVDKTVKITVKGDLKDVRFEGVRDRMIDAKALLTKEFMLDGVTVMSGKVDLGTKNVKVSFDLLARRVFEVTYRFYQGKECILEEKAVFFRDAEAPVIQGAINRKLESGQEPDLKMALEGISITDDYTQMDITDIEVMIEKVDNIEEEAKNIGLKEKIIHIYFITYQAVDEMGNQALEQVYFYEIEE